VTLITNTGPLIALAKVDQIMLLKQLFGSVSTPLAVQRELLAKRGMAVTPLLKEMRHEGYWLSDNLLEVAAKLSGEG
jgi:predicted nucleic acid-binding protein